VQASTLGEHAGAQSPAGGDWITQRFLERMKSRWSGEPRQRLTAEGNQGLRISPQRERLIRLAGRQGLRPFLDVSGVELTGFSHQLGQPGATGAVVVAVTATGAAHSDDIWHVILCPKREDGATGLARLEIGAAGHGPRLTEIEFFLVQVKIALVHRPVPAGDVAAVVRHVPHPSEPVAEPVRQRENGIVRCDCDACPASPPISLRGGRLVKFTHVLKFVSQTANKTSLVPVIVILRPRLLRRDHENARAADLEAFTALVGRGDDESQPTPRGDDDRLDALGQYEPRVITGLEVPAHR
jgi:hypothetical protein